MHKFIYRLETCMGTGIYFSGLWTICCGYDADSQIHPLPSEDPLLKPIFRKLKMKDAESYHYGFLNKKQYLKWVYQVKWRKNMAQRGIRLIRYKMELSDVICGKTQVMFRRDKAISETVLSPTHFD